MKILYIVTIGGTMVFFENLIKELILEGHIIDIATNETEEEVPSYTEQFNTRPWMKSAEITDKLIAAIESGNYEFLRVNYPGGDMVGHFGELEPTIIAMESIDVCLKRIIDAVNERGGVTIITADHGNAEELIDEKGNPKTSHTTNKIPFILVGDTKNIRFKKGEFGLANVAATVADLLGVAPADNWEESMLEAEK